MLEQAEQRVAEGDDSAERVPEPGDYAFIFLEQNLANLDHSAHETEDVPLEALEHKKIDFETRIRQEVIMKQIEGKNHHLYSPPTKTLRRIQEMHKNKTIDLTNLAKQQKNISTFDTYDNEEEFEEQERQLQLQRGRARAREPTLRQKFAKLLSPNDSLFAGYVALLFVQELLESLALCSLVRYLQTAPLSLFLVFFLLFKLPFLLEPRTMFANFGLHALNLYTVQLLLSALSLTVIALCSSYDLVRWTFAQALLLTVVAQSLQRVLKQKDLNLVIINLVFVLLGSVLYIFFAVE